MGSSGGDRISLTPLSLLPKEGCVTKLFMFFVLAFSCLSFVVAAPTDSAGVSLADTEKRDANSIADRGLSQSYGALLPKEIEDIALPKSIDDELEKRESAGLYWGPHKVGNLKLYLTNPHMGYAGPKFPNANHVNFHVDKEAARNTYKEVVNLHIVKYSSGSKSCLYIWDSVTKATVFDNCFDNFVKAIPAAVEAVKDFVDSLLRNADFFAAIVIIGALVVALAAVIASLGVVAVA